MDGRWEMQRVEAAAPDASSWSAGTKLAGASVWSDTGTEGTLIWGSCQGSGKNPYKVLVDTAGPRYKCSCPSRKFPCKHALGLMILWAQDRLDAAQAPSGAAEWADKASTPSVPKATASQTAEQKQAAAERLAGREARIGDGLADLDRWLCDQMEAGLARSWTDPGAHFERQAARMVDAQAPGIAARLRELVGVAVSGPGWPGRMLEEFALLHLAAQAWPLRDELEPGLAQTLRQVVGLPVASEDVAATPGVRGLWLVAGLRDVAEGKLTARRVWLHAVGDFAPQPWALVLTFAGYGQALDVSLAPGTVVDAELHFYPGSGNYRALVGQRFGDRMAAEVPGWAPPARTFDELVEAHRRLLAANPWAGISPVSAVVTVIYDRGWRAQDPAGRQVRLVAANELDLWRLHGILAGRPGQIVGEWCDEGLRPTGVVTPGGLELL